jgi:hypothetical protein
MSAVFVIIKDGTTRTFFGRYMGEMSTAVFVRGPRYAAGTASDLDAVDRVPDAAAGFLLDFATRSALIFDTSIVWHAEEGDEVIVGTRLRVDALAQLDLYPEEQAVLVDVLRAGTSEAAFVAALRGAGLKDHYGDWSIEWVDNAAALRLRLGDLGARG